MKKEIINIDSNLLQECDKILYTDETVTKQINLKADALSKLGNVKDAKILRNTVLQRQKLNKLGWPQERLQGMQKEVEAPMDINPVSGL